MAVLTIDLKKLEHNARLICERAQSRGVSIYGVTKVLSGLSEVAFAFKRAGVEAIADSRLENIAAMRKAGVPGPFVLLRLPSVSRAAEVVSLADVSLNSELCTLLALNRAAGELGVTHRVVVMVDVGDLREGVCPKDLQPLLIGSLNLRHIEVIGIGTNLACYGGIIPDENNMALLRELAGVAEERLARMLVVSGGNSSSLALLFGDKFPLGINNLRIGEGIVLGRETIDRQPLPGAHLDACKLTAEIIELKLKPSVPIGTIGQDAFGGVPSFVDRGLRQRAILSLGRQDTVPEGLTPLLAGAEVIGASSDHLLLDVTAAPRVRVGDWVSFIPGYGALLAASTSRYVKKVIV
ncbi:MAG: Ornithine racemase [Firmicutes bacterium]|nr:Ornithine racemase [candidate division NPL-UPA2 bacterium]